MIPWVLLLLTVGCAYMTYDTVRWGSAVERAPFSIIAKQWKGGLSHLPVARQTELKRSYSQLFVDQIGWLFSVLTLILAVATVRAFLS
jgi:hypothetical protein